MNTNEIETCDDETLCCTCEQCGKNITSEDDKVTLSISIPVGYDDYDYESMVICSECDRKDRSTVYREPPVSYGHDPEDEIPF